MYMCVCVCTHVCMCGCMYMYVCRSPVIVVGFCPNSGNMQKKDVSTSQFDPTVGKYKYQKTQMGIYLEKQDE